MLCSYEVYGSGFINDCNNIPNNSICFVYPSAQNTPFAGYNSIIFTFGVSNNHKHQFAWGGETLASRKVDVDTEIWTEWVKFTMTNTN